MTQQIREIIENMFEGGGRANIIIYPFGNIGMSIKHILNTAYGVMEDFVVDDHLCRYNNQIHSTDLFDKIEVGKYFVILATDNIELYDELIQKLLSKNFNKNQVYTFRSNVDGTLQRNRYIRASYYNRIITKIGKHSYGPICIEHHLLIEEIGAFCCFAPGVEVVPNHEMKYITTHDIIYSGKQHMGIDIPYEYYKDEIYYLEGIEPKDCITRRKRSRIGNDVWLGRNVIITNGACIGNGVIAGAGAVITKDVPDYAVVVGVPAKIIKYRYSQSQIEALNRIQWWNWSDEKIRNCYDDFYLPIDEFIEKYDYSIEEI